MRSRLIAFFERLSFSLFGLSLRTLHESRHELDDFILLTTRKTCEKGRSVNGRNNRFHL